MVRPPSGCIYLPLYVVGWVSIRAVSSACVSPLAVSALRPTPPTSTTQHRDNPGALP